jgi:hypothetical protein
VDSVNAIRVPQDYMTQREPLRQANGALGVLSLLQRAMRGIGLHFGILQLLAEHAQRAVRLTQRLAPDDLKPVFDQVYAKVVTAPADALQPLIPAAQIFTHHLGVNLIEDRLEIVRLLQRAMRGIGLHFGILQLLVCAR